MIRRKLSELWHFKQAFANLSQTFEPNCNLRTTTKESFCPSSFNAKKECS